MHFTRREKTEREKVTEKSEKNRDKEKQELAFAVSKDKDKGENERIWKERKKIEKRRDRDFFLLSLSFVSFSI